MTPPSFLESPISWVIATAVGMVATLWKTGRQDNREMRETLLAMQKEQSEAMHAAAEALNRNTDALKANTEVIRRADIGPQHRLSSGQQ